MEYTVCNPMHNKKKKIMIVIDSLIGGGAERIISYICNNLDRKKYDVCLYLSIRTCMDYEINNDVKIYSLFDNNFLNIKTIFKIFVKIVIKFLAALYNLPKIFSPKKFISSSQKLSFFLHRTLRSCFVLKKVIEIEKPDVILSTLTNSNIVTLLTKYLFQYEIPVWCRIDNVLSEEIKFLPQSFLYKILLRFLFKRNRQFIAVSDYVKKDLINNFKVSNGEVITIKNGVDINDIVNKSKDPLPENIKKLLENKNFLKIVTVGRLTAVKQQDYILKALSLIRQKINFLLFVIGDGDRKTFLENLTVKLGLTKRVFFLGFQKNPFSYMSKCDLFVLGSRHEGFPNVILEAMALGLPIVTTNFPGISEILENGKDCLLVPLNNVQAFAKILELILMDEKLRVRLSKQSIKKVQEFSLKRMLNSYQELF